MRRLLPLLLAVAAACTRGTPVPLNEEVGSLSAEVVAVYEAGTQTPLRVVTPCREAHGGSDSAVPAALRGTAGCPYALPRGEVDVVLHVRALSPTGEPMQLDAPIAFRAVPGDLSTSYPARWAQMKGGELTATLTAGHLFGQARFWAEDAPPQPLYADGGLVTDGLPEETRTRSFATGATPVVFFEEPTIAKVQLPDGYDNRSSPFVGQFMTLGSRPESGGVQLQSCDDLGADGKAQPQDGKPVTLVVTGMDPGGFFLTDVTACRVKEDTSKDAQVWVAEPDGYLPGTYGSLYVYNYSYPDGLYQGDMIWSVSGAVQEFTSTTQLVFPAWAIRESVHTLPADQWGKNLALVPIRDVTLRTCGGADKAAPYVTDALCGHNKRNLKMESLESALVRVRNVRFPEVFTNCDKNGNGSVPFFCESKTGWQDCNFGSPVVDPEADEMQCNIDCVIGQGTYAGKRCAEQATFRAYGQYPVIMAPPGPAASGLDDTLPSKITTVTLQGGASVSAGAGWPEGAPLALSCTAAARFALGGDTVTAGDTDTLLAAGGFTVVTLPTGGTHVAFRAEPGTAAGATCTVGYSTESRINLVTRDALPDLVVDCNPADTDPAAAADCQALRAATYDVVGHLRQTQPGRPRWTILPRDADDVCCHPGPGLSCPRPLKACPAGAGNHP